MKKTMRKILALVLVLMMTIPVMAIQASADTLPANYADVADGALIYKVDFNGTEGFWTPGAAWAGMSADPSEDGTSVRLIPEGNNGTANVWGAELPAEDNKNADGKFRMLQSSYTVVFTLNAEDEDQEMGLLLDWKTGFAITPGKDSFRYIKDYQAETVFTGTYEGTKSLTQTYAIEIKDEGTAGNINDHSTFSYNVTEYNLYVMQDGAWVQIFSLKDSDKATALKNALNWGSSDWEFVLRMFRNGLDENQRTAMTVSDMKVYKGIGILSEFGLADGASVRMSTPTGLRFTGAVNKAYFDELSAANNGNVKMGMLITPTDYLNDNSLAFTKEALDACEAIIGTEYLEIDADAMVDKGNYYKINCVIANVLEDNYDRAFSARLYIKIDGEIVAYSEYNEKDNSRSIAEVAEAAYKDLKDSSDDTYKYEVTLEGGIKKYSPYENREVLEVFFGQGEQE